MLNSQSEKTFCLILAFINGTARSTFPRSGKAMNTFTKPRISDHAPRQEKEGGYANTLGLCEMGGVTMLPSRAAIAESDM